LDVPTLRPLFGVGHRPYRKAGSDLSPRPAVVIEAARLRRAGHVLIVTVDPGPGGRWAAAPRGADSGEEWRDHLVANGEQGGDGAGGCVGHVVAPGPAGLGVEPARRMAQQHVGVEHRGSKTHV
jgi:hypothetical protein